MTTKERLSTFARQLVSNKIKYVLYCIFIVLFMVYGIHIKRNTRNDTLCFFYYKGIVNTNTRVSCEDLFKRQKTIFGYSDTVWIDSEDFSKLRKLMKATAFTKQKNRKYNSLDVRFIVCSEHDAVGFSDFMLGKCENRQGILLHIDSIFEYSIKKTAKMYNYYSTDELSMFNEIKKYGIPKDYSYAWTHTDNQNPHDMHKMFNSPFYSFAKILVVETSK